MRQFRYRSLTGDHDATGLAVCAAEVEAVDWSPGELPILEELLCLIRCDRVGIGLLILRHDGHRQPETRSAKVGRHSLQQLQRLGGVIVNPIGVGAKLSFDHGDVVLLPALTSRAVASKDVPRPEDGPRLRTRYLVGALTCEDAETVLV